MEPEYSMEGAVSTSIHLKRHGVEEESIAAVMLLEFRKRAAICRPCRRPCHHLSYRHRRHPCPSSRGWHDYIITVSN